MSHKRRSDDLGKASVVSGEVARFWAKVNRGGAGDCWPWRASTSGSKHHQYGQFTLNAAGRQRHIGAHVFAYELEHGRGSAAGLRVCHSCDNPPCCNPAHLFIGTHADNMTDASVKGRLRVSRPNAQKVSTGDVLTMRELVAAGMARFSVAERFGVSPSYVTRIMAGSLRQYDAPMQTGGRRG